MNRDMFRVPRTMAKEICFVCHEPWQSAANKKHEICQRDSVSVEISSREFAKQKIDYIHFNPVSGNRILPKIIWIIIHQQDFIKQVSMNLVF